MQENITYKTENNPSDDVRDTNNVTTNDNVTTDSNDIYHTLIFTEDIGSKPKVFNGDIMFNITIDEKKDDVESIEGVLVTDIFFEATDIYQLDSWRFCLNHVSIKNIQCDSTSDYLKYIFIAKTFATKA